MDGTVSVPQNKVKCPAPLRQHLEYRHTPERKIMSLEFTKSFGVAVLIAISLIVSYIQMQLWLK